MRATVATVALANDAKLDVVQKVNVMESISDKACQPVWKVSRCQLRLCLVADATVVAAPADVMAAAVAITAVEA